MVNKAWKTTLAYIDKHTFVFLYFGFFVLALIPSIFSIEGTIGTIMKIATLLIFTGGLIFFLIKRKIHLNYRPIIIVGALFAIYSIYYLFILPNSYTFVSPSYSFIPGTYVTVPVSLSMRFNSIISIFNICYFACLFLFVLPKAKMDKSDVSCFGFLFGGAVLLMCLIAIPQIKSDIGMRSIFNNKNTFGIFLLFGVFLTLLVSSISKKKLIKIIMIGLGAIFTMFSVFSKSSTSTFLTMVVVFSAVELYIFDIRVLKMRYRIIIITSLFALAIFLLLSPIIPFLENTSLSEFLRSVYRKVLTHEDGGFAEMFTGRGKFWMFGGYIIDPIYLMFGHGIPSIEAIVYASNISYQPTRVFTNAYLTIINGFGVFGSLFYLGVFIYLIVIYYRSKDIVSDWLLVFVFIYMIYGVFESLLLFESFSVSLAMTPILVVPAICLRDYEKAERLKEIPQSEQEQQA